MKLIDADALDKVMYNKSFETDDGRQKWNSGFWIRYKIYEEAIREAPEVDAIPIDWIKKWMEEDDSSIKFYIHLMLLSWRTRGSDYE